MTLFKYQSCWITCTLTGRGSAPPVIWMLISKLALSCIKPLNPSGPSDLQND